MRNISFMLTQRQVRERSKTVTRRLGWWTLPEGTHLMGVEKGQGLKKGEKVVRIGEIVVTSVQREPLRRMVEDPEYGRAEVVKEGFPDMTPEQFVEMFCEHNGCVRLAVVNRLEFEYLPSDIHGGMNAKP